MADDTDRRPTRFRPIARYTPMAEGPNVFDNVSGAQSQTIDGTKQKLRDPRLGSPFTFAVAPPNILIDALMGNGEAKTDSAFDPLLRQAFEEAQNNLEVVLAQFDAGQATTADVEIARQGLLGTRGPVQSQNINIIEAATRSTDNFAQVLRRRTEFTQQSSFFASGPQSGKGLATINKFVASNGVTFDPDHTEGTSTANQAAVSDLTQALDVIYQLNVLLNTPPLTLLVNPETLTITHAKKQQYQDRNRFNYIFQSWGEEQIRLSVSGKAAGFVVGANNPIAFSDVGLGADETNVVSGYQWASKLDSASWQNFMSMFQFYRNNGYIYDRSGVSGGGPSEAHLFIGTIEITYDQFVYVGNFENFSYSYSEMKQHGAIEFSFEFVVSSVFDRGCDRTGAAPVRPYFNPPTPSPGMAAGGDGPVIQEPAVRTGREIQPAQLTDPATCILDPMCNPLGGNPQQNLEQILGDNFRGTIRFPTDGG